VMKVSNGKLMTGFYNEYRVDESVSETELLFFLISLQQLDLNKGSGLRARKTCY